MFHLSLVNLFVLVNSEVCTKTDPYGRCSTNSACGCFPMAGAQNAGVCAFLWKFCSQLIPCESSQDCSQPDHICVHHHRCNHRPVCYPLLMANEAICPPISPITSTTTTQILETTTTSIKLNNWEQNGQTVAGGNQKGDNLNQLYAAQGIFIDQNNDLFVADTQNNRIMKWKPNATEGTIVAGGNETGKGIAKLNRPTDIIVVSQDNSLIIADWGNWQVVQWFNQTYQEVLIQNIICHSVKIDKYGFLYASDLNNHEVRRWKMGDVKGKKGTVVAGGNGIGSDSKHLNKPTFIFVDDEQSVYVSDWGNHRVMKWGKDARYGILVAGGYGKGSRLSQLDSPSGLFVDHAGHTYIADYNNHRVIRWSQGKREGELIVGGNGIGNQSNQLNIASGVTFDVEGNLYVTDYFNHRVQKFGLISQ
ncbi:unnamed protein product [Adineta ricciae]|uniref:Uncharacterized protein n=1 Tax=Adineta ricciae TaxID=249248 RepID=A0A815V6L4_ADIRI|nr:unnamed protein product [Adineta ricciae]